MVGLSGFRSQHHFDAARSVISNILLSPFRLDPISPGGIAHWPARRASLAFIEKAGYGRDCDTLNTGCMPPRRYVVRLAPLSDSDLRHVAYQALRLEFRCQG